MALAVVQDLRQVRGVPGPEELEDFETDVLAGFVLARASAGLTDGTIRGDVGHLEKVRDWFGRPLWEMGAPDADAYFGKVIRDATPSLRAGRAGAVSVFFDFLDLRHRAELHRLTGRLVECPLDEMNRPRATVTPQLRVPPSGDEVEQLFAGWREDLASCRKFAPAARNYAVARLSADVGLRINEARMLDLDDVRWDLGRFGKLNVRFGKGSRRSGPRQRMVPLINGADRSLHWYVEDVWGHFGADHTLPGAALFPSERRAVSGRAGAEVFRTSLAQATARHLPAWAGKLTPHVLRHFCASQLYLTGMDLVAVQELLGHSWIATTMRYIHVHRTHIEDAWTAAHQRAENRWKGLAR
ncbi:tyrosine-type recombinase/integrase [Streptomyces noursei]|uniref:tyrosine-type recombinase/integrase n=1 Tax=Streptomyces noursei TaxID=1971 RepID=UPI00344DE621